MRDADRKISLREIIDRLPLGKRQRALAEESFDSMTEAEAKSTVDLYQEVADGLPAALAAVRRIRGIVTTFQATMPEATVTASPESAQHTPDTQTASERMRAIGSRYAKFKATVRMRPDEEHGTRTFNIGHYSGVRIESGQPLAIIRKDLVKASLAKNVKAKFTPNKNDAWRMAKQLCFSVRMRRDHDYDTFVDEVGNQWIIKRTEGVVDGYKVEAFRLLPKRATAIYEAMRGRRTRELIVAVRLNGETTHTIKSVSPEFLRHIGAKKSAHRKNAHLSSRRSPSTLTK
ncbi:hypothetical protein J2848_005224 [Azospirillum lipoferum]|uniref:Uncharacterized protein n=1 Tax=Azospirillum lipoferum TaxID=193 RepID=A0A5A9GFE7_AZOLI|nr:MULTISPECIES: hypothetical protein [Azospirillum]KAA0593126.1 hypothetical protein FZ942_24615 [Azospirillum lipoferum]MCP1613528.1 hypothetical protein [Azospirillum lipoferum]MDW5532297.1 hypothetical protein [Azospirillum sp. NL1]